MEPDNKPCYYVYAYLRSRNSQHGPSGSPYYIGKGKGLRAFDKANHRVSLPTDKSKIIFLHENITEEDAFKKEIELISFYGRIDLSTGCLRNLTNGGDGSSNPSPETIEKLRRAGRKKKPMTEEHRLNISKSKKGHKPASDTRIKLSKSKLGNKNSLGFVHSDETRKKMSEAKLGWVPSEQTLENMKVAQKNRARSPEELDRAVQMCRTMSQANRGKSRSLETRQKISEGHRRRKQANVNEA